MRCCWSGSCSASPHRSENNDRSCREKSPDSPPRQFHHCSRCFHHRPGSWRYTSCFRTGTISLGLCRLRRENRRGETRLIRPNSPAGDHRRRTRGRTGCCRTGTCWVHRKTGCTSRAPRRCRLDNPGRLKVNNPAESDCLTDNKPARRHISTGSSHSPWSDRRTRPESSGEADSSARHCRHCSLAPRHTATRSRCSREGTCTGTPPGSS